MGNTEAPRLGEMAKKNKKSSNRNTQTKSTEIHHGERTKQGEDVQMPHLQLYRYAQHYTKQTQGERSTMQTPNGNRKNEQTKCPNGGRTKTFQTQQDKIKHLQHNCHQNNTKIHHNMATQRQKCDRRKPYMEEYRKMENNESKHTPLSYHS